MNSRVQNTARNMVVGVITQILMIAFNFFSRTVFVKLLPTEYLGLNGVFSNIISLLSLSELGIGTAIIVNLYKPIAEKDYKKIRQLMTFYATAYRTIGIFVMLCGLVLYPFVPYLCKTEVEIEGLQFYFLIFVLQSASSYFFAYRRSLITAHQMEYICTISNNVSLIIMHLLQVVALILTKNYLLYLLISICCNIGNNIFIYYLSQKKFPFIKGHKKDKLKKSEIKELFKDVGSTMTLKLGRTIVDSTDNLLISSFIGLYWNGIYSNYALIIRSITQFIQIIFNSASASIGDFNSTKTDEETFELFKVFRLLGCWIYGFCAICFIVLFNPFITLWIGKDFLLDIVCVIILAANFYFAGTSKMFEMFSITAKLFHKTKIKTITTSISNLIASLIFVKFWGIKGIFLGTLVSYLVSGAWVDVYYLYKLKFKKKISEYVLFSIFHIVLTAGICGVTSWVSSLTGNFILKVIVCMIIPNLIYLGVFFRTKEFKTLYSKISNLLIKIVKRSK